MGTGLFDDVLQSAPKSATGLFSDVLDKPPPQTTPQYDQLGNYIGETPPQEQPSGEAGVGSDIAATLPSALARGVIGLATFPTTVGRAADLAVRNTPRLIGKPPISEEEFYNTPVKIDPGRVLTPENAQRALESFTGPLYEPKTTAGKFVENVGELVPGAVLGPAAGLRGVAGNITKYAVVPGVTKKAVEDVTGKPEIGTIAALIAGGASGATTRSGYADQAVSRAARDMTPEQVTQTEALVREARDMGIDLTRAEAAQHVTGGGTNLGNIQRVIEGKGELLPYFARRPEQVQNAVGESLQAIAPPPANAFETGPAVGEAARGAVADVQRNINTQTRPLYQQAEQMSVNPQLLAAIHADPVYQAAFDQVRGNPALNYGIEHLGADNPAVIHRVLQRLQERAADAIVPGEATPSNIASSSYREAQNIPRAAVETATGSNPQTGQMGYFERAQLGQSVLRQAELDPLMAGPVGKLATTDPTTRQAINIMFGPDSRIANAAPEIQTAIRTISQRNPNAARDLVRAHVEKTFSDAMAAKRLPDTSFGGASFRARLVGNPIDAANMSAAITGLPNGHQILPGFDRLLNVLEATGWRQPKGSLTSFNTREMHLLEGGRINDAKAIVATVGLRTPSQVMETIKEWNLGRNTRRLAYLLTDPRAADAFHMLATSTTPSRAGFAIARLVLMAHQYSLDRERKPQ
jgi:hypothetical protein